LANHLVNIGYKPNQTVGLLTGQLRGYERDRLADSPVFARFKLMKDLDDSKAHVLVCTSAGEVGVDFSADHALIESCYLDAFIQRLGRVNRYGMTRSTVWLFEAPQRAASEEAMPPKISEEESDEDDTEEAETLTESADSKDIKQAVTSDNGTESQLPRVANLLAALGGSRKSGASASPAKLAKVWASREPKLVPTPQSFARIDEDILDILTATSFDELPDAASLDLYLHGERSGPPEIDVIWRAELDLLSGEGIEPVALGGAIGRMGVRQAEILRLPLNRLLNWLRSISTDRVSSPILVRLRGKWMLEELQNAPNKLSAQRTKGALIVIPPAIGGLGQFGEFAPTVTERVADVFDLAAPDMHRAVEMDEELLTLDAETGGWIALDKDTINRTGRLNLDESETCFLRFCLDFLRMAGHGDFSLLSETQLLLTDHHLRALRGMELILSKLDLPDNEGNCLKRGTGHHDDGKRHPLWQRAVNGSEQQPLAKAPRMNWRVLDGYRHELGSLLTAAFGDDDLALHSVGVHHGWGRPHFLPKHYDAARYAEQENQEVAVKQLERFRRLEQRYGRWTLAYLEALLKCADIYGSLR
jgi:CRISPR-associated endonuclease/helicase Cas3